MVNQDLISNLKSSCIGIGIKREDEKLPLVIAGSGFFIDSSGYFITATHVARKLREAKKLWESNGMKNLKIAIFATKSDKEKIQVFPFNVEYTGELNIEPPGNYHGPKDYDLTLGRAIGKDLKVPFLKIKSSCKLELFTEIFMCGYPGGDLSFNLELDRGPIKTSPLLQMGRISGLMPADNTESPEEVITDIIGTGGSSGSPIVDSNDGEVIAVAQNVISGIVYDIPKKKDTKPKEIGSSLVGLTYGISNYWLNPAVYSSLEHVKKILDENGKFKSNVRDVVGIIDKNGKLNTT